MCVTSRLYRSPSRFFVIAIAEFFAFREDWHLEGRVNPLVRQYQNRLESILRDHPHLSECVTHCVHCGIRFLTDPRNAGRTDLRCPFGCREHHRRQASNHRATAYYGTEHGKRKKEIQNARRKQEGARRQGPSCSGANEPTESRPPESCRPRPAPQAIPRELLTDIQLVLDAVVLTPEIIAASPALPYLTSVIGLLERRSISRSDLVAQLLELLRQHSMAACSRQEYVHGFLPRHPP